MSEPSLVSENVSTTGKTALFSAIRVYEIARVGLKTEASERSTNDCPNSVTVFVPAFCIRLAWCGDFAAKSLILLKSPGGHARN